MLNVYGRYLWSNNRQEGQKAKMEALGLEVDEMIIIGELGSVEFRKINPKVFEMMSKKLHTPFEEIIYVKNNLKKDFVAPRDLNT